MQSGRQVLLQQLEESTGGGQGRTELSGFSSLTALQPACWLPGRLAAEGEAARPACVTCSHIDVRTPQQKEWDC